MNHEARVLLQRVESIAIDAPGTVDTFSRRLARENRWSPAFTARVIEEYRCFLVVLACAKHPVSPPDAVDQAWHLHLLYSREYQHFCQQAFGRVLYHAPSRGGRSERARFEADYRRTLEAYERLLGKAPPEAIWPAVAKRFEPGVEFARIDTSAHWLISKPRFVGAIEERVLARTGLDAIALLFLAALALTVAQIRVGGPKFLEYFVLAWIATLVLGNLATYANRDTRHMLPARELDPYEAAFLAGGATAAVDGAISLLVTRGAVSFDTSAGTLRVVQPIGPDSRRLEVALHAAIAERPDIEMKALRQGASAFTEDIAASLTELGLVTGRARSLPMMLALATPVAGIARIVVGVSNGYPVGKLMVLCVISGLVAWFNFRPTFRTRRGDEQLSSLRGRLATLRHEPTSQLAAAGSLPVVVGLFGIGALTINEGEELAPLRTWLQRPQPSAGNCGGSTSCGGGGDGEDGGGGCGGCGGCGGD